MRKGINPKSFESIFGGVLRGLRLETGLNQKEFAEKVGLHRTYINEVETGKRNVSIQVFIKLCRAADKQPGTILQACLNQEPELD